MGFRRAKSTQGNTNCQKNIFEDDQVPGRSPPAGLNKHPNCLKMKFEGDLTSIMVTRDFFGRATTTRFSLTRQGNGCGVDGNHDVDDRG